MPLIPSLQWMSLSDLIRYTGLEKEQTRKLLTKMQPPSMLCEETRVVMFLISTLENNSVLEISETETNSLETE